MPRRGGPQAASATVHASCDIMFELLYVLLQAFIQAQLQTCCPHLCGTGLAWVCCAFHCIDSKLCIQHVLHGQYRGVWQILEWAAYFTLGCPV